MCVCVCVSVRVECFVPLLKINRARSLSPLHSWFNRSPYSHRRPGPQRNRQRRKHYEADTFLAHMPLIKLNGCVRDENLGSHLLFVWSAVGVVVAGEVAISRPALVESEC